MRILHLSWEYPPLVHGGLGRHVHALAEAQAAAGHDVVVVAHHPGTAEHEGLPLDETVNGVRIVRAVHVTAAMPRHDDLVGWVLDLGHAMTRTALALGSTWRPEVVHGHDWMVAHAAANLRQAFAVPVVATMHATEAGRHQGWLPTELSRTIHTTEWWFTYEARRVIACSEHMRWEVTRLFELPPDKVDVVPNGVDRRVWSPDPVAAQAARERLAPDGPLVVVAGRLEWEKGVHTVVEALPRLRRRHPGLRLVVVGRGSQRDALAEQARRLRVARSVEFTGWLDEDALRAVVAAADVAVVPSVYEPFGLVALEAAALGTPLVVAGSGGLVEVVRDGESGLVVPPLHAGALADAVTALLRDEVLAHRMARAARESVEREHDWAPLARRTVEVYRAAVEQERALIEPARPAPALRIVVRDGNLLRDDA